MNVFNIKNNSQDSGKLLEMVENCVEWLKMNGNGEELCGIVWWWRLVWNGGEQGLK